MARRISSSIGKRPRRVALPAIVLLHIVILSALAIRPSPPAPDLSRYIDVSLADGRGVGSPIASAPKPPTESHDIQEPEPRLEPAEEASAHVEEAAPQTEARDPAPTTPAGPPVQGEPPEESADLSTESPDVLALVEQLTGADATALNTPPAQIAALSDEQVERLKAAAFGSSGGCAIDALLQDRYGRDEAVQAALTAIPSTARSVSNAIQLWDGDWVAPSEALAGDPLAAVRAITIAVVENAPPRCRNQPLRGPRFVIVPLRDGATMVVVIGSGEWRWVDVLPRRQPRLLRWLGL
ncbi:hypothetical protein [Brevundimonas sp. NIBR10]|uniref:hypothetical protein n=1 Tax=Brevundimonas sp. NIBR10 TaxID=3015997 RepID=UPI0022F1A14D|nr:hypothetical protein [Brevundimonas sp. NIBR10]